MEYEIGKKIETWFSDSEDGKSVILDIKPYTGKYKEYFTLVIKVSAPRTKRGYMEFVA